MILNRLFPDERLPKQFAILAPAAATERRAPGRAPSPSPAWVLSLFPVWRSLPEKRQD
jgi:hypothetical protein